jgi:hypothetical protein
MDDDGVSIRVDLSANRWRIARADQDLTNTPSWRWLVSSQAEGVFGPPVSAGRVGFMRPLP